MSGRRARPLRSDRQGPFQPSLTKTAAFRESGGLA